MYPREEVEFGPLADASLESFAASLAALSPHARLDRDRLMYLAGQASVEPASRRPRRWAWPAAFSAMTAVAACLLALLASRPEPKVIERIVRVPVNTRPENMAGGQNAATERQAAEEPHVTRSERPPREIRTANYLELRARVLALGLDDWTTTNGSSEGRADSPPDNYRELLKRMLREG